VTTLVLAIGITANAWAAQTLKFAHGYEVTEPYRKWALWAAEEIAKRTDGHYTMEVFPISALAVNGGRGYLDKFVRFPRGKSTANGPLQVTLMRTEMEKSISSTLGSLPKRR
jgi:hypothetical protein